MIRIEFDLKDERVEMLWKKPTKEEVRFISEFGEKWFEGILKK
jgi:hypothetical protein